MIAILSHVALVETNKETLSLVEVVRQGFWCYYDISSKILNHVIFIAFILIHSITLLPESPALYEFSVILPLTSYFR